MSSMSIEAITSSRSCDFPGYKEHERVAKDMERKAVRAKMLSREAAAIRKVDERIAGEKRNAR